MATPQHVMLSYQWNVQSLVEQVYQGLRHLGINAWMDVHGGITGNINDRLVLLTTVKIAKLIYRWSVGRASENPTQTSNLENSCIKPKTIAKCDAYCERINLS